MAFYDALRILHKDQHAEWWCSCWTRCAAAPINKEGKQENRMANKTGHACACLHLIESRRQWVALVCKSNAWRRWHQTKKTNAAQRPDRYRAKTEYTKNGLPTRQAIKTVERVKTENWTRHTLGQTCAFRCRRGGAWRTIISRRRNTKANRICCACHRFSTYTTCQSVKPCTKTKNGKAQHRRSIISSRYAEMK